jgi:hypothetical protein
MRTRGRIAPILLFALLALACRGAEESNDFRGRGLSVLTLPPSDQASVYRAGVAAAFHLDDPGLSLLLDPRYLPRESGLGPGPRMPDEVSRAVRAQGTVRGTCQAPPQGTKKTLSCQAEFPGYVVRFSEVFGLGPDSVQVYVNVQKYDTPQSGATEAMRFENVYQIARHAGVWSAEREGRIRQKP